MSMWVFAMTFPSIGSRWLNLKSKMSAKKNSTFNLYAYEHVWTRVYEDIEINPSQKCCWSLSLPSYGNAFEKETKKKS